VADGVQVEPDVLDNLARGRRDNMQWPKNYVQVVAPDGLPLISSSKGTAAISAFSLRRR